MSDPVNADTWAGDEDALAFLKEAEALIEGPPTTRPGPAVRQSQPTATQPAAAEEPR
jgi:hypothetical protein